MLHQDKNLEHNICAPLTIICCVNLVFIESTVNLFKQFNVIYFIIKASVSKLMKKTEPSLCCLVHTLVPEVFLIFFFARERERETVAKKIFKKNLWDEGIQFPAITKFIEYIIHQKEQSEVPAICPLEKGVGPRRGLLKEHLP